MRKKVNLEVLNNFADCSNIFINMVSNLINTYKMEILSIDKFNGSNRNFGCVLNGKKEYVSIKYNYEDNSLSYEICSNVSVLIEKEIEQYILNVATKTTYHEGDVITDMYGSRYIVVENFQPSQPIHGCIKVERINVVEENTNIKTTLTNISVAQL